MGHKRLKHKQTAVMLALMVLAREVSNPELKDLVGFVLDGEDRKELNKNQLVTSYQRGRPYVHELTDLGREWCRAELATNAPPPPSARSALVTAMYTIFGGLDEYLTREKLSLDDVFPLDVELTDDEIERNILTAYQKLARSSRDWVGLVDLRPLLGKAPVKQVDEVLRAMDRAGRAHLAPQADRRTFTDAVRAAAVRVGREDNHLIAIEAS